MFYLHIKMLVKRFKRDLIKRFVYTLRYSRRSHITLFLIVLCLCVYSYYVENKDFVYSDVSTKIDKVGILISCSYNDNMNSLSSTLALLSPLALSLSKTTEIGFECEIYIGVESVIKIEEYLKFNETEMSKINFHVISKSSYSNTINELSKYALDKDFDYFAIIQFDAILKWKYWTTRAVRSLKGLCPSDFGVVVQECDEHNKVSVVSRKHMDLFEHFFPPNLKSYETTEWLINIYLPDQVTSLSAKGESVCTGEGNKTFTKLRGFNHTIIHQRIMRNGSNCVISYSLYGTDNRYTDGALENANLIKKIYPGWEMWIHHDSSVPLLILDRLCEQKHVSCFNMTESKIRDKMSWRFLVASAKNISQYIIRDIDSRLDLREKAAVNEWIHSGKLFHVMRDHPNHNFLINGGMWGGSGGRLEFINEAQLGLNVDVTYRSDMRLLGKRVWPILRQSVLQHDSYFCMHYGGKAFPTLRGGSEFVGSVYINGRVRENDVQKLKSHKEPTTCISGINLLEEM